MGNHSRVVACFISPANRSPTYKLGRGAPLLRFVFVLRV